MAAERKRLVEVEGGPGELSMLFEISQILDSSLDLRTVVEPVLEAITRSLGMKFATLTLLNRQTGEIAIEAAYGLSPSQKRRGRYKLGEGITGQGHPDGQGLHRAEDLRGAAVPGQDGRASNAGWGGPLLHLRAHQDGPGGGRRAERGPAGCGPLLPAGRRADPLHRRLPDRAGGAAAPVRAGGAGAADGGEPAPAGRAEGQVSTVEHHRQLEGHAERLPAHRAGFRQRHHGAAARGKRNGQGAGGPRHPLRQPARRAALRQGQLRRAARRGDRERALRARKGGVHRRGCRAQGPFRAGPGRHAFPGRDRGSFPRHADQAAAGPAGTRVRARGGDA